MTYREERLAVIVSLLALFVGLIVGAFLAAVVLAGKSNYPQDVVPRVRR